MSENAAGGVSIRRFADLFKPSKNTLSLRIINDLFEHTDFTSWSSLSSPPDILNASNLARLASALAAYTGLTKAIQVRKRVQSVNN